MKVRLVNANSLRNVLRSHSHCSDFDAGLLSVAAVLENDGHDVSVVDLAHLIRSGTVTINESFHARCAECITRGSPVVIGFNTRCDTYPCVLNIARHCKLRLPSAKIVLGGPQATFTDLETLREFPFIDAVVRGEGEQSVVELLRVFGGRDSLSRISGISYRSKGRPVRNRDRELIPDLDALPLPAYHLMEQGLPGRRNPGLLTNICVGRGCRYRCKFCSTRMLWRNTSRQRSPESVLGEIEFLRKRYGIKRFYFGYDNFLNSRNDVEGLCRLLERRNANIEWECGLRVDLAEKDILGIMARAGCRQVHFGVESGSARIQRTIGKGLSADTVLHAVDVSGRIGITTVLSFIVGFPEESIEDIDATLKLALDCRLRRECYPYVRLLGLMPGTPLFAAHHRRLTLPAYWPRLAGNADIARLSENRLLIRKYPSLFSVFYAVRPRHFPHELLFETVNAFMICMNTYGMSLAMLLEDAGMGFTEFWGELRQLIRGKGARVLSREQAVRLLPGLIRSVYAKHSLPLRAIEAVLRAETENLL